MKVRQKETTQGKEEDESTERRREKKGQQEGTNTKTQTVFTLLLNRTSQHGEKTFQFPIPKSNKRSLKPHCL